MGLHRGTPGRLDRAEQINPQLRAYLGARHPVFLHFARTAMRWRAPLRPPGTARRHRAPQDGGHAQARDARGWTAFVGCCRTITRPPLTDPPYLLKRVIEPLGSPAPQLQIACRGKCRGRMALAPAVVALALAGFQEPSAAPPRITTCPGG